MMPSGGRAVLHDARSLTTKTCKKLSQDINRMEIISPSKLLRMGIITLSFFTITNSFQRLAGSLSIHSGRPFIATRVFGALSTATSCLLSLELQELLVSPFEDGKLVPTVKMTALSRVIPNLGAYYCLERRSFLTAIPSSVIAIGVHAQQNFYAAKGSVASTNKVATKGQRKLVQLMGKNFGCHQCGSKQWNKIFIADHMPPTYFVNEMNQVWWRKILKKKVEQELWPQCVSCFRLQGTAVKMKRHILIYHHGPRLYHFAPAIVYYFLQNQKVKDFGQHLSKIIMAKRKSSSVDNITPSFSFN